MANEVDKSKASAVNRDLKALTDVVQHIAPAAYTSTQTPANGVDLAGWNSAVVEVNVGVVTAAGFSFEVQHSEDDGAEDAYAAIADADLDGTEPTLGGAGAGGQIYRLGIIRSKRFVRVVATDAGAGDAVFGVNVLRANERHKGTQP